LVERLAKVVNTTPGLLNADERIVAEELGRALQNIALRSDRGGHGLIIAAGPQGGEYARFIEALRPRALDWAVQAIATEGSVDNALRVDSGEARFGLVQSDVAAAAVTGTGMFEATGPLRHLRGVAALFPEPLHVVVRADSGIEAPGQLASRRVAVGLRGSGTRPLARQVLRAHGVADDAYTAVDAASPGEALDLLAAGGLDAVLVVVSAPWQQLIEAGARTPLRVLPLDPQAIAAIDATVPGMLALAIPARTYPGQDNAIATVAATALLVANESVPEDSVRRALDFLFVRALAAERGLAASRLSRERAGSGMTLPLHEGAVGFFGAPAAAPPRLPPPVSP
jgi:TRAP transporter TAXI family solute receptor